MELTFERSAVDKWARFSNDFNPIHFDLEHAKTAGCSQLIVHGMLALLSVKQEVEHLRSNLFGQAKSWMKFRAMFRNPIPHSQPVNLQIQQSNGKLHFSACEVDTRFEHFRGSFGAIETPHLRVAQELTEIVSQPLFPGQLRNAVAEAYPTVNAWWIALDTMIFADFMRTKQGLIETLVRAHMASLGRPCVERKLVVQVNHAVSYDAQITDDDAVFLAKADDITYGFSFPEVVANRSQWVGTARLPVHIVGRLVMVMEIGILVKLND